MPQIVYAAGAIRDLYRLQKFLRPKNPAAAKRAADTITKALKILGLQPLMGQPAANMPEHYREWPIPFGGSGYVARYRFDGSTVTILALRHQKEAGF